MLHDYQQICAHMSRIVSCPNLTRFPAVQMPDHNSGLPSQTRFVVGPVAILWDIENCPVPGDVSADDVAGNIRMAFRVHPAVEGVVTTFSAYGDFNHFPRRLREGCQRTGINLIDVPNGKKDASDKAILVDMFLFALDNPPPCTILLISGDVDFAPALHKLGQRGYTVVLAVPAGIGVSSALCNAGRYVWDWPSVARGEGFVPAKVFLGRGIEEKFGDVAGVSTGLTWQFSDVSDPFNDNERNPHNKITVGGLAADLGVLQPPRPVSSGAQQAINKNQSPFVSFVPLQRKFQASEFPVKGDIASASNVQQRSSQFVENNSEDAASVTSWVQPGDLEGLKNQLIKLIKINRGELPFVRVPSEYSKLYGRPLYLSEYGCPKLVHLIERMPDAFSIKGEGAKRKLCLKEGSRVNQRQQGCDLNKQSVINIKQNGACTGSDSDMLKEVILLGARKIKGKTEEQALGNGDAVVESNDGNVDFEAEIRLEAFKQELQELLVSHACKIPLSKFLRLYQQKYAHELDLSSLQVDKLEMLFDKVKDVASIREEDHTKKRFIIAK